MAEEEKAIPDYQSPFATAPTAYPSQSDEFMSFEAGGSKKVQPPRHHDAQESKQKPQTRPCHFYSLGGTQNRNNVQERNIFYQEYGGFCGNSNRHSRSGHWQPRYRNHSNWRGKGFYGNPKGDRNKSEPVAIAAYIHSSFLEDPWEPLMANLEHWSNWLNKEGAASPGSNDAAASADEQD